QKARRHLGRDDQSPQIPPRLARRNLRHPAHPPPPHQASRRRHRQAPPPTSRRLSHRNRHHPRSPGRRRHRAFPQNRLHLHSGRLRVRLQILRLRTRRLETRPLHRRNCLPASPSLSPRRRPHPARPPRNPFFRQHRRHGHGRTPRQL